MHSFFAHLNANIAQKTYLSHGKPKIMLSLPTSSEIIGQSNYCPENSEVRCSNQEDIIILLVPCGNTMPLQLIVASTVASFSGSELIYRVSDKEKSC